MRVRAEGTGCASNHSWGAGNADARAPRASTGSGGADRIIDYTAEDFTTNGKHYDLILQLAGIQSARRLRRSLTHTGTLALIGGDGGPWIGPLRRFVSTLLLSTFVSQRLRPVYARPSRANPLTLTELIEAGTVTPLIDRMFPLSDAVAAIRIAREDHVRGKIVITI